MLPVQRKAGEELSWDVPLCQGHSNVRLPRKGESEILKPKLNPKWFQWHSCTHVLTRVGMCEEPTQPAGTTMCSAHLSRIPCNNAEDDSCQVLLVPAGLFLGDKNVLGLHVPFCADRDLSRCPVTSLWTPACPGSPILLSEKLQGDEHCGLDDH